MKPFWVYMLRCADGSYYVGHTDDLESRLAEHDAGYRDDFTSRRMPLVLVYSVEMPTRAEALTHEMQVKRWTRAKKEALIRGDWDALSTLASRAARSPRR